MLWVRVSRAEPERLWGILYSFGSNDLVRHVLCQLKLFVFVATCFVFAVICCAFTLLLFLLLSSCALFLQSQSQATWSGNEAPLFCRQLSDHPVSMALS